MNKIENEITSYEQKKNSNVTRIGELHKNRTKLMMYVKRELFL